MNFYEVIENRESVKNYSSKTIDKTKLDKIINAAMKSPSWKNNSSYKFILVDQKDKIDKLSDTIINETNEAKSAVKEAPVLSIIVADPSKSGRIDQKEYYLVDSAIAMEHFVLAATAEGYGTCWLASIDEDKVRSILSIPSNFRVVAMTPLGEIQSTTSNDTEKNINDYVFLNNWNNSYIQNTIKH